MDRRQPRSAISSQAYWRSMPFKIAMILILATVLNPMSVAASSCDGDAWADGVAWSDNYWVGYASSGSPSCDLNGRYTLGIQRINWDDGYRRSSIDGYYGSKTHQDVISFQAFHNLTQDGLVGPNTWSTYRSRITYSHSNGGMDIYKTKSAGTLYFGRDTVGNVWYVYPNGSAARFDRYGP